MRKGTRAQAGRRPLTRPAASFSLKAPSRRRPPFSLPAIASKISPDEAAPIGALVASAGVGARTFEGTTYRVTVPPEVADQKIFSKNGLPMNSTLYVDSRGFVEEAKYTLQALVKANPDIAIMMPKWHPDATPAEVAKIYGIPEKNVSLFEGGEVFGKFPQDNMLAGAEGLLQPPNAKHAGEAAVVAKAMGIPVKETSAVGQGGDTMFLTRPDGSRMVVLGRQSLGDSGVGGGMFGTPAEEVLENLAEKMKGFRAAGIPIDQVMPFGPGTVTIGEALAGMSPESLAKIDPEVLGQLKRMGGLTLPQGTANDHPFQYHTDLLFFSPDGRNALVNEDEIAKHPGLKKALDQFGFDVHALPANLAVEGQLTTRMIRMNAISGVGADGRTAILVPTEASDPSQLTPADAEAIAIMRKVLPDANVIPIGGRTARLVEDRGVADGVQNWGPHCRTNVMPYKVELKNP